MYMEEPMEVVPTIQPPGKCRHDDGPPGNKTPSLKFVASASVDHLDVQRPSSGLPKSKGTEP